MDRSIPYHCGPRPSYRRSRLTLRIAPKFTQPLAPYCSYARVQTAPQSPSFVFHLSVHRLELHAASSGSSVRRRHASCHARVGLVAKLFMDYLLFTARAALRHLAPQPSISPLRSIGTLSSLLGSSSNLWLRSQAKSYRRSSSLSTHRFNLRSASGTFVMRMFRGFRTCCQTFAGSLALPFVTQFSPSS